MIEFIKNADNNYVLEISGQKYSDFYFVLAAPVREGNRKSIAVLDENHNEIAWIDELDELSAHIQEFITESVELNATFFEITSVDKISCRLYPSEWSVTAGGVQYVFWIENEDDLMHLHDDVIMIRTNIKKLFIIRFLDQLDKKSRVLLQPFIFLAR